MTTVATRVGYRTVAHFTGARQTHETYEGIVGLSDGSRKKCGHQGHRTPEAAVTCAKKAAR